MRSEIVSVRVCGRCFRTLGTLAFSECFKRAHADSARWHGEGKSQCASVRLPFRGSTLARWVSPVRSVRTVGGEREFASGRSVAYHRPTMDPIAILFVWILCALIGCLLAGPGQRGNGFVLGLLFGPLGVLIAVVLGNRAAAEHAAAEAMECQTAAILAAQKRPAASPHPVSSLADVPDQLTIRRNGEIIGTWPLADVLGYLATGELLPSDHYLHNPAIQRWRLLSSIA